MESEVKRKAIYSDEIDATKKRLEEKISEIKSVSRKEVTVISPITWNLDEYYILFQDLYTVGVHYHGKDYFASYENERFPKFPSNIPAKPWRKRRKKLNRSGRS